MFNPNYYGFLPPVLFGVTPRLCTLLFACALRLLADGCSNEYLLVGFFRFFFLGSVGSQSKASTPSSGLWSIVCTKGLDCCDTPSSGFMFHPAPWLLKFYAADIARLFAFRSWISLYIKWWWELNILTNTSFFGRTDEGEGPDIREKWKRPNSIAAMWMKRIM